MKSFFVYPFVIFSHPLESIWAKLFLKGFWTETGSNCSDIFMDWAFDWYK